MISIFSETDPIKLWLNTPKGGVIGMALFGRNIHEMLFKNSNEVKNALGKIVDTIQRDLGIEIAQNIESIELVSDKDFKKYILINNFDGKYNLIKVDANV